MRFIFCADYWNPQSPDSSYEAEFAAAQELGLACSLLNFEALVEEQNAAHAVRRVEPGQEEPALYRGWMLKPAIYTQLYLALAERGLRLINTPETYLHCHYLPESYPIIANYTPFSCWLPTDHDVDMDEVMKTLAPFGSRAVLLKDYVKSQKHAWFEACYIPSAADRTQVERVVRRFLELQGENLNKGLVFREFVQFEPLATHSKSGMPLTREYRLFVLKGEFMQALPYWEEGEYATQDDAQIPLAHMGEIARQVQSSFFTMDIAKRVDGAWMIIELGDGQVAGLPARADVRAFYQTLAASLSPLQAS